MDDRRSVLLDSRIHWFVTHLIRAVAADARNHDDTSAIVEFHHLSARSLRREQDAIDVHRQHLLGAVIQSLT